MPKVDAFFKALEKQLENKLPFVVYSRPINSIIKFWLQKDDALHKTNSFSESGFVFAPFDLKEPPILFPKLDCEYGSLEIDYIQSVSAAKANRTLESTDKKKHESLVSKGLNYIEEGYLNKVVLSRVQETQLEQFEPIEIFKRLFNTYKNAMVYCWYHPKVGLWLGATPELLFKVEGQQLTAISLAGTQPYEPDKKPTWTPKELDEQQIVTDFLAQQIAPFTSSTKISEVESIRAGNLWHLKTRLISTISSNSNLTSIVEALHPTPAVCGFPKDRAKEFILNNEGYDRAYYTGFLGELNLKKSVSRNPNRRNVENNAYGAIKTFSNFYVNLRCMQIKDDSAFIYVGGGITKESNPAKEYEETQNKAETISTILR
ncbi:chorismate-binding protein [Winogradskyella sp. DF17]|uniref:Chorismate-binding protein n=1 Tax=Winogradskyella pelagia TaxID=2819984 RepID=A0ABS3T4C8_9FLAO|nr:chorismate-binding protein [Winogradskyella sp. DF17]MBO3117601.1 chorismate-binding protein [Winogradskyella sp. DF17]